METEDDEQDEEVIQTPGELLKQLKTGEFEPDPIPINYEIKRLIYDDDVTCGDFDELFHGLLSILDNEQIVTITQVLFPGFCNWIEILLTEDEISSFSFSDFYEFHEDIISELDEDACSPCMADFDRIMSYFYKEAERRFQQSDLPPPKRIRLASLLKSHDELGELLVSYEDTSELGSSEFEEYLDLVEPDKILDPILKSSVKEMIRDSEW